MRPDAFPLHGGDRRWAAARYGTVPRLDFSVNLNPLGPPPELLEALAANLGILAAYPDPHAEGAAEALAAALGVPAEAVVVTNGGAEAIDLVFRWCRPRRLWLPAPSFGEYARAARAAGAQVLWGRPRARGALRELPSPPAAADALALGLPANPTGYLPPPEQLAGLLARALRSGQTVVLDEAFLPFVRPDQHRLAFEGYRRAAADRGGLVVVGSLTKAYALPGLRLGYVIAAPAVAAALRALQPPWSVNGLAQVALTLACGPLRDHCNQWLERARRLVEVERTRLAAGLNRLGFRPLPSEAPFLLVDALPTGWDARRWTDALARRGCLVRFAGNFEGLDDGFLRVSVRRPDENDALLAAAAEILLDGVRECSL